MRSNRWGSWRTQGMMLLLMLLVLLLLIIGLWQLNRGADGAEAAAQADSISESVDNSEVTPTPEVATTAARSVPLAEPSLRTFDLSAVPALQEFSLSPRLDPHTFQGPRPQHAPFEMYNVKRGDTPVRIASIFDISPETLLGGNPQLSDEAGLLQVGDELIILPIDGVLHNVQHGESLESISRLYGVPVAEIVGYGPNNLSFPFRLYADSQILIPGAVREVFKWDPPQITQSSSSSGGGIRPLVVGTGVFQWPVGSRRINQVYWYAHPGLDIGVVVGSPVYASDTGTVVYASWSPYCYGNLIVVDHGNGFQTFYAHLSGFNVGAGQIVNKGQVIGYSGNTGCSSGPHLHLEIRLNGNRDDPTWYLP